MLTEVAYILCCLALAYVNAVRIGGDKRIYHGLNALVHLVCWAVVFLLTGSWWIVAALPFIGRLFFDTSLNLMRGLPLDYMPAKPKSIIDQAEQRFFHDGLVPKLAYAAAIIIINILKTYHQS